MDKGIILILLIFLSIIFGYILDIRARLTNDNMDVYLNKKLDKQRENKKNNPKK